MKTVVLGPPPPELEALIQRRRALGLDGYDEVWEGVYHGVAEVLVADPAEHRVRCFERRGDSYVEVEGSKLLGVDATALTAAISWP